LIDDVVFWRMMPPRETIVQILEHASQPVSGAELTAELGISRQALHLHLRRLIEEGRVVKEGRTRGATYRLAGGEEEPQPPLPFRREYATAGLEEDRVFDDLDSLLQLRRQLSPEAHDIARYAFTEMLNNAIEHSRAERCRIEAVLEPYVFRFRIRDRGHGAFATIAEKFALPGEEAALGELLKGKTTTMKERHSGEGIFFTSRAAHRFSLRSHKLEVVFDNQKPDVLVKETRHLEGTEVTFEVSRRSRKKLADLFREFAPEEFDYRFERTRVYVKIYQDACVSRSEARRMLHGLDRFSEVILDFQGVKSLGQGFADEVWRVFGGRHPEVSIRVENLSPSLEPMVRHVREGSA
jgi:biotin operon repressor/anti-sigma regulatory factor (Ser/Thr protein kinase)